MTKKFINEELKKNYEYITYHNYKAIPITSGKESLIEFCFFQVPKSIFIARFNLEHCTNSNNSIQSHFELACDDSLMTVRTGKFTWELYFSKNNDVNNYYYLTELGFSTSLFGVIPGSIINDSNGYIAKVEKGNFHSFVSYAVDSQKLLIYKQITKCTNKALEGINRSHKANCILSAVDEFFPNLCDRHRDVITLRVLDNIDRKEPIDDKEALQNENTTLRAKLIVLLAKKEANTRKLEGEEPKVSKDFTKNDQEKPRIDLIPKQELLDIAEILTFGAKKYSPDNWKKANSPEDIKRIRSSLYRHLFANELGMIKDDETGKSHLAHAACNLLFLMYFETENETKRS